MKNDYKKLHVQVLPMKRSEIKLVRVSLIYWRVSLLDLIKIWSLIRVIVQQFPPLSVPVQNYSNAMTSAVTLLDIISSNSCSEISYAFNWYTLDNFSAVSSSYTCMYLYLYIPFMQYAKRQQARLTANVISIFTYCAVQYQ